VTREAYPDPGAKESRLVVVDLEPVQPPRSPVSLAAIKKRPDLSGFPLVRLPRLSVMPVSESEWTAVMEMAGRA
jgi:predicted RNA-binding protein with PUA-like domain